MPIIETRRDLARHLQAQMMASRTNWLTNDDEEEAAGRTMLKTYLLEAHCADGTKAFDALSHLGASLGIIVNEATDPDLFHMQRSDTEMWCDTSLGRFWRLHTTAPVGDADKLRDCIVAAAPWLDNVWLSPTYLEQLAEKVGARMMTFSLKHDRRPLNPAGQIFSEADFVSLRLWASSPETTLRKLRNARVFPRGVSLRSVKLRSESPDGDFCVAEYFYRGKVTASGTSFDEHNRLVLRTLQDYRSLVEGIEQRYAMGAIVEPGGRRAVIGAPIQIAVEWDVADLRHAVGRLFNSTEPFRLWGLPEELGPDHFRARAVDLHFGGVLSFDITRQNVVIQLPIGVCGNTIVRFLNNIRYHVNSEAAEPA